MRDIQRKLERLEKDAPRREPLTPFSPQWIDAADRLLETMPDEEAEKVLSELSAGDEGETARAFIAVICEVTV